LDALLEVAAREVFELMLGCKLSLAAGDEKENLNVTSMVGLAGQLCGVLSVRCDNKAAALMASKMLGVDLDKVGPEVSDAAVGQFSPCRQRRLAAASEFPAVPDNRFRHPSRSIRSLLASAGPHPPSPVKDVVISGFSVS
jgi:hypothetical protein